MISPAGLPPMRDRRVLQKTASDRKRLKQLKVNLVDQSCQASGGPCKDKGKDMKTAHMGMGISAVDLDALVGEGAGQFKAGAHEQKSVAGCTRTDEGRYRRKEGANDRWGNAAPISSTALPKCLPTGPLTAPIFAFSVAEATPVARAAVGSGWR
jgi:hypothetical protein